MYYFLVSLFFGLLAYVCTISFNKDERSGSRISAIWAGILTFLVSWGWMWLVQPKVSLAYSSWIPWLLIPATFTLICRYVAWDWGYSDLTFGWKPWIPLIIFFIAIFYCFFTSNSIFTASSKQRMLEVKEIAKEESDSCYIRDIAQIQPESMILVDGELARKYAEATLEQDPATGSVCSVGKLSIQNLNGTFNVRLANGEKKTLTFKNEQVYVAPLEHSSFFKWKKNRTTPGYIMVSAQKQNVVYFVTEVNNEKLNLKYLGSACFGSWWKRYLRNNGYACVEFADRNLELDDHGRPFMVIPLEKNTVGYTCTKVTSVVILDIQTGDFKEYDLKDVPNWVDRIYPSDIIENRIIWWGAFQRGFWNALFAQVGVRFQTPGIEQVYTNGNCYWYTGIQSGGADDGTSGFMLINTRTGKSKLYTISGVNEEASSQKISNYKINAANIYPSRVLMYNIKNEPTYFATCKSESGEFMGYAFASVKYRDVCGVGKSLGEAYENYSRSLRSSRNETRLDGEVVINQKSFTVKDVTKENDNYFFLFKEDPTKEFVCPNDISWQLKWTRPGDSVSISYYEGDSHQVTLTSFENKSLENKLKN